MHSQRPWRLLINGQWREAPSTLAVENPFTAQPIAQVPLGNPSLLREAVDAASAAFAEARRQPPHARASLLLRSAQGIAQHRSEFVALLIAEAGKPRTLAEAEVDRAILTFQLAGEEARRPHGQLLGLDGVPQGQDHLGWTKRVPLGVIAAITPFNFPLNLVAHKIAPALATGNTMVVKPAPKTPLCALRLAEVLVEAGMPQGQINFVTCTNEDAQNLLSDERVRKISFTGSAAVGWPIKERAGRRRVTLELGGNAALILHEDADWHPAIASIASAAFGYAGQSCISIQRILVHTRIYDAFRSALLAHIAAHIHTGDPQLPSTLVGPMIDARALDRIDSQVSQATADGALVLCGGRRSGPCYEPTVLENLPPHCALALEEAFAPVASLHRYEQFSEAIGCVNASPYGLQTGVFTKDIERAMQAFDHLEVGAVLINQVPTWRVEHMPYGGTKASGFGREGIQYAMEEMTELRSLILRNTPRTTT